MNQKYINSTEICNRFGIHRSTLIRWQKRDNSPFPSPAICGSGFNNRWEIVDVEEWEKSQNSPTIDSMRENHAA